MDKLNLTDQCSKLMKGKKGDYNTNYNVQTACGEDQIITFCNVVTSGNDKAQLIPALKEIAKNTNKTIETVLADADYGNFDSFEYMDTQHIKGYVPYANMNTTYEDKPFHSSHFIYDETNDLYTCPQEQKLKFYRTSERKDRNHNFKHYRTNACLQCPFQKQCCENGKARRVIDREIRQDLKDQMKQRLRSEQGQQMYLKRLHPIESLFGHLKYNLGYTSFLMRGLEKVKAEFQLICLTYNLRKLITQLLAFWVTTRSVKHESCQKSKITEFPRLVNELLLNTPYICKSISMLNLA